ncbi:hypothetical protein M409DRAFT_51074 [Zasmidium cellare ATCC 36951]|uniref:Uncharacterized protein n=1 Tax=Zasmidium cellare ATCC 36951 TaxID=1080233 RepID=A0A6A6CX90_ZASCE|nr:uncharacterized protein M409DRAFT_51074 [Zasmidium cellare ATCC 36951]KAF2170820.1 hypothetical protein M409DRAFT_51074 [Zasmidium cellare ATCC 36951]
MKKEVKANHLHIVNDQAEKAFQEPDVSSTKVHCELWATKNNCLCIPKNQALLTKHSALYIPREIALRIHLQSRKAAPQEPESVRAIIPNIKVFSPKIAQKTFVEHPISREQSSDSSILTTAFIPTGAVCRSYHTSSSITRVFSTKDLISSMARPASSNGAPAPGKNNSRSSRELWQDRQNKSAYIVIRTLGVGRGAGDPLMHLDDRASIVILIALPSLIFMIRPFQQTYQAKHVLGLRGGCTGTSVDTEFGSNLCLQANATGAEWLQSTGAKRATQDNCTETAVNELRIGSRAFAIFQDHVPEDISQQMLAFFENGTDPTGGGTDIPASFLPYEVLG